MPGASRGIQLKDSIREQIGLPLVGRVAAGYMADLILVDGRSVDFDHILRGGERVAVYPMFERLDVSPVTRLRPTPLRESRFVVDVHLGTLARYLRLLGFDTVWRNDVQDQEIIRYSLEERRIILTRDLGILKDGRVTSATMNTVCAAGTGSCSSCHSPATRAAR